MRVKKIKDFFVFLLVLVFSGGSLWAENSKSDRGWKNDPRFTTGILKDFTPSVISPAVINIGPGEPIFLVVAIDRETLVDPRGEQDREKIRFKAVSGNGTFSDIESPSQKLTGAITVTVNTSGLGSVLFYPVGVSGPCLISADCVSNPSSGSVSFKVPFSKLNEKEFSVASKKNMDEQEKWKFEDSKFTITTTFQKYDSTTKTMVKSDEKNEFFRYHSDDVEMRDKNETGKILRTFHLDKEKAKAGSDIAKFAEMWGTDKDNFIFLIKNGSPNGPSSYQFFFIDKLESLLSKVVSIDSFGVAVIEQTYVKKNGVNFPLAEEEDSKGLRGNEVSHRKKEYKYR